MEHENFDMGDNSSNAPKFAISSISQSMKCCVFLFVLILSICIALAFIFILVESDMMTVNYPRVLPSYKSGSGSVSASQDQNVDEVLKLRLVSMQEHVNLLKSNMSILNSSNSNSSKDDPSDIDFLRLKNTFQNEVNELNHRLNNFHATSYEVDLLLKDVHTQVLHLQLRINEATDRKIKLLEDGKKGLERELTFAQEQLIQEKQNHLKKSEEVLAYRSMLLKSSGNTAVSANIIIIVSTFFYSVTALWL